MILSRLFELLSILLIAINILNPISYKVEELNINNRPQRAYTLSIDVKNPFIEVTSLLSFDLLYGFEKASTMVRKHRGLYGVNGMFYDEFGLPYGILIIEGNVVLMGSIGTPTFTIDKQGKIRIEEISIAASVKGEQEDVKLTGTNTTVPDQGWVLFDRTYGKTNRVERKSINYFIQEQIVTEVIESNGPVSLNESDYVLTNVNGENTQVFKQGEKIQINFDIKGGNSQEIREAFQTGGWLVKDGKNVAKDYESFIGYTTALNPRTLIGITEKDKLIFKVVDGRKIGISEGITGDEAAQLMLLEGCVSAAYLDGGASSTFIAGGKVLNNPSNGEEREIAHSISIGIKGLTKNRFFMKYRAY